MTTHTGRTPTVDPVQLFCLNFPSSHDFSSGMTRRTEDHPIWRLPGMDRSDVYSAKISRFSLEVLQCALLGHAAAFPLAQWYMLKPISEIVDARSVVLALLYCDPPLADSGERDALVAATLERVAQWQAKVRQRLERGPR